MLVLGRTAIVRLYHGCQFHTYHSIFKSFIFGTLVFHNQSFILKFSHIIIVVQFVLMQWRHRLPFVVSSSTIVVSSSPSSHTVAPHLVSASHFSHIVPPRLPLSLLGLYCRALIFHCRAPKGWSWSRPHPRVWFPHYLHRYLAFLI